MQLGKIELQEHSRHVNKVFESNKFKEEFFFNAVGAILLKENLSSEQISSLQNKIYRLYKEL